MSTAKKAGNLSELEEVQAQEGLKQPLVGTKAYWEWYKKEFTWAHVSSEDESFVEIPREGEASYTQPPEKEKAKPEKEADTPERLSCF